MLGILIRTLCMSLGNVHTIIIDVTGGCEGDQRVAMMDLFALNSYTRTSCFYFQMSTVGCYCKIVMTLWEVLWPTCLICA